MRVYMSTPEEIESLDYYDFTRITAVNTCPTWGVVRYHHNKSMSEKSESEAPALAMGSACHEAFAAERLWRLTADERLEDHFIYHGIRLFGEEKFESMGDCISASRSDADNRLAFVLQAFYNYGYEGSPDDRRRTPANAEEALAAYLDLSNRLHPIWIQDYDDPVSLIGIEMPYHITIDTETEDMGKIGFFGKLDGMSNHPSGFLLVEENKTGASMNDAWAAQWPISAQVTGYCAAGSVLTGREVNKALVRGLQIPLPRTSAANGVQEVMVNREPHQFHEWLQWFVRGVATYREYADHPLDAPRHFHSCTRYFRPCPMHMFCTMPPEDRVEMFNEMHVIRWDPTDE